MHETGAVGEAATVVEAAARAVTKKVFKAAGTGPSL